MYIARLQRKRLRAERRARVLRSTSVVAHTTLHRADSMRLWDVVVIQNILTRVRGEIRPSGAILLSWFSEVFGYDG